jgi:NAD(P)-dependent dehydrogenase (short-subunit alcohol dehydrogenase family)
MDIRDKVAIVTGAASGIGSAIAQRFAVDGARAVVVADVNFERAEAVARTCGATALRCDVSREDDIRALVEATRERHGPVDVYVSNAGILGRRGGLELDDELWTSMWQIHAMAHVWAARAVVPAMVACGEGCFVVTASAAGLLSIVESAPYAVTKHAALGFAEWLRIAYGRKGVRVSCLCPQAVQTDMTSSEAGGGSASLDGVLQPEQVAAELIAAMRDERFLVLPHPEVLEYFRSKAQDYDRWIGGMQKLYARHTAAR